MVNIRFRLDRFEVTKATLLNGKGLTNSSLLLFGVKDLIEDILLAVRTAGVLEWVVSNPIVIL